MKIIRSEGVTPSENRLVKLGERVFMGLWSYPNPMFLTSSGYNELCDLLVICGDNVLVFSDKNIKFSEEADLLVAWKRWERKAILASIKQLHHAENIIRDHPELIWLNKKQKLPVSIPSKEKLKIHLICVANGATDACKRFFGSGCTGSLRFSNMSKTKDLKQEEFHALSLKEQKQYLDFTLFYAHDYMPSKTFVHVFDDFSLPFVLNELNTLTDFVWYLEEKERFIRTISVTYTGEEDLLFRYLHNFDNKRRMHVFLPPEDEKNCDGCLFLEEDWGALKQGRDYLSKIAADRQSYFWDELLRDNSYCVLNDITEIVYQSQPSDKDVLLRYVAIEDRLSRRIFSNVMLGAIDRCEQDQIRMTAFMSRVTSGLLYIFLQVDSIRFSGFREYIEARRNMLERYVYFAKAKCTEENVHIDKIVGIAIEPPKYRHVRGTDMVYAEFKDWPQTEQEYWNSERIKQGVFRQKISDWNHLFDREWPDSDKPRKIGVNEKCPCGSGKKYKKCCGNVLKSQM